MKPDWRSWPTHEVETRSSTENNCKKKIFLNKLQGNSCNIGIIARDPAFLPYIRFEETIPKSLL